MKVAIVHELLTMRGGAERVARIFADMFPDAPVYTLLYNERELGAWFPRERIRPSMLQRSAWLTTNHHYYLKQFPRAAEAWDFSMYDLVLSSSSAFAHGIITNGRPKHLCYVHSPARYLWDRTHDVMAQASGGFLGRLKKAYLTRAFHTLRIWDSEAADRADMLLAASQEVQRRIELYWRRTSDVLSPPIDDDWFTDDAAGLHVPPTMKERYFLIASTLARYKRIDLAIEAANTLKVPLKIAGDGTDRRRLQRLAGPTVTFLGRKDLRELKRLYADAIALIIPGEEDFGLTPLEAMACSTPVIAYRKGGVRETVDARTGTFFAEPTAPSLAACMTAFDRTRYDPATLKNRAQEFNRASFEEKLRASIDTLMR